MMYLANIKSSIGSGIKDIEPLEVALTPGVDISAETIYWLNLWKASDFPEIVSPSDYIVLCSTDHDDDHGGIHLGYGNEPSMGDYSEAGTLASGYQAETPILYRFPNNPEPIHLYYHTKAADPANGGIQATRLRTTIGGDLMTANWTQQDNPLGLFPDDQHIGYLNMWPTPHGIEAIHLKGLVDSHILQTYQHSTTTDGLTFERGAYFQNLFEIEGRWIVPTFGEFFFRYGKWWWLGTTETFIPPKSSGSLTKRVVLCQANEHMQIIKFIKVLNNGEYTRTFSVRVFDGEPIAHLFLNNKDESAYYSTFDLTQLKNYAA